MPIFSADGFDFRKTRTGNSVCGKKHIYNIIKHNIYTEMKGGMISFSGKLTTVIDTAINHLRLKHNGKIEGTDQSFLILSGT